MTRHARAKSSTSSCSSSAHGMQLANVKIAEGELELHNALLADLRGAARVDAAMSGLEPLIEPFKKITVADSPTRSLVIDARGKPCAVLFVSSSVDADYIEHSLRNARAAKQMLGEELGSVILEPLAEGRFRGLSFALWPWHRRLSPVRGVGYLQRQLLLP